MGAGVGDLLPGHCEAVPIGWLSGGCPPPHVSSKRAKDPPPAARNRSMSCLKPGVISTGVLPSAAGPSPLGSPPAVLLVRWPSMRAGEGLFHMPRGHFSPSAFLARPYRL